MNVHVPQDEISRAEAMNIVNANKQYNVSTSGDPIRGLIQARIYSLKCFRLEPLILLTSIIAIIKIIIAA